MKTPPSPSHVPGPPIADRSWSKSLKQQTREAVEACRINPATGKLHLKNINSKYGHITALDLMAGRLIVHYEESGECFTAENIEVLLAADWAID